MEKDSDLALPRIAIVCDQLATSGGAGGAEKVLQVIRETFPEADLYTTVYNPEKMPDHFRGYGIRTSFIQRLPWAKTKYQWYLPLMPAAIEHLDLSGYDIIISSSHSVAKGVIPNPTAMHICYCHSPIRYAWDKYNEYLRTEKIGFAKRAIIPFLANYLRLWDRVSADRVDHFVANSLFVSQRIRKYYGRPSTIIFPPVDLPRFQSSPQEDYYVMAGRLVAYKRADLAIQAFNTSGRVLKIIGDGPERARLESLAGPNVHFLGRLSDRELADTMARAKALIFPQDEDFGIVPLESQACGVPVIAFGHGGVLDTVRGIFPGSRADGPGRYTGVFFETQSVESLAEAVDWFEKHEALFDKRAIREHVQEFSVERFRAKLSAFVAEKYAEHYGRLRGA